MPLPLTPFTLAGHPGVRDLLVYAVKVNADVKQLGGSLSSAIPRRKPDSATLLILCSTSTRYAP